METVYTPKDVFKFATKGKLIKLKKGLNQGNNSTNWYKDKRGFTAFHWACINGHRNCVELLLKYHDINSKTYENITGLHMCAQQGHHDVLMLLLSIDGIEINSKNALDGCSALQDACKQCNICIVKTLLEHGADINCTTIHNVSSLHVAAQLNSTELCDLLLSRDNIDINIKNSCGYTPLHDAAYKNNINIVKILLGRSDITINIRNKFGCTALHTSIEKGYIPIANLLLEREEIDVTGKSDDGRTLLHSAIHGNYPEIVQKLLSRNEININDRDNDSAAAIIYSCSIGNPEIVKMLLSKNDLDIDSKTDEDVSGLYFASHFGRVSIVEMLLEKGISIDDDIDSYAPHISDHNHHHHHHDHEEDEEDEEEIPNEITDCRPLILAELEHRRQKAMFDLSINHYIEYQPYIDDIYSLCYPKGNLQVVKPPICWTTANALRDKYYFDEILFYVHMYVANVITRSVKRYNTDTTISTTECKDHFSSNSNKTFTLMKVLSDRLKEYLKPKIQMCGVSKCLKVGANICSRCRSTYYCSIECQKRDWKQHKHRCTSLSS